MDIYKPCMVIEGPFEALNDTTDEQLPDTCCFIFPEERKPVVSEKKPQYRRPLPKIRVPLRDSYDVEYRRHL